MPATAIASPPEPPTAAALATGIAAGQVDPVALCETTLEAIAACDDPAIFLCTTPERARREAAESAARQRADRRASPLDGVPLAWKDLFDLGGLPTTAGSRVLCDAPPAAQDAAVVARLAEAGLITVGRVNMTEFAFSGLGLNPHYGTPRNPHGHGQSRIPGGSSSGSAVAVARGLVPLAMGSDTSGSVRIPAAFNGIVGYKASGGRYPMAGVYPLAPSLDTLGPLCRSVEDAILADATLRGAAEVEIKAPSLSAIRLVVPKNVVFDNADSAVVANFEAALQRLARAGVEIERQPLPALDDIRNLFARHGTPVAAEAYSVLAKLVEGPRAAEIDHRVVARARLGGAITAEARAALVAGRRRLMAQAADELAGRFVAFPTVAIAAPALAPLEADNELFFAVNALVLRNTMLGSFLDWCGVSIPNGSDDAGLPTGLLLNATAGADDALLTLASAAEATIREPIPTTGQPQ